MGLPAGDYVLQFWNSIEQPSQEDQPRLLSQCLQLIKALQEQFDNEKIAIPSNDPKAPRNQLEICILSPEYSDLEYIAEFLSETAESLGLDYQNFVKQDLSIERSFDQQEADNVSTLAQPVSGDVNEETITTALQQSGNVKNPRVNDSWRSLIQQGQRASPFQITRSTLQELHSEEDVALHEVIQRVAEAMNEAVKPGEKTSVSLITSLAAGTVFTPAAPELKGVPGDVVGLDAFCIDNPGLLGLAGAASGSAVLGPLGVFVGALLYATTKDAANVLLVVNDTPNDLYPRMEWIENGERRLVPEMIPGTKPGSQLVSCGLFIYSKYEVKSFAVGTYGSAFGVSFDINNRNFSVGMDCPNSALGGNNSIEVHNGEHAQRACQMALDSGCLHGWCNNPYVDVKIADHWGKVNWGRAIVMND